MPRDPIEGTIQNLFRLRELENSVADETSGLLVELFNEMAAEISRVDPVGADLEIQDQRVQELIDEIAALTGSTFDEVQSVIADRATEIGVQQAEEAGRQFRRTVGEEAFDQLGLALGGDVVSPSQMRSIVTSEPFRGATLSEWAENQSERTVFKVRRQIQLGLSQNETLDEMVRRVRGRQAGFLRFDPDTGDFVPKGTEGAVVRPRFQGGVLNTTTREAESIVRTAINHVASRGHEEVFSQDPEVSREYTYTAVIDSRTTILCASLDGQTFEYGEGPMPPQHFNALPSGAQVWTSSGPVPIECVRVGDEVLTHEGRFRPVYAAMGKNHEGTIRDLGLSTGGRLRITDEHPVLTLNAGWKRADEVEVGDQVVQNREQSSEMPVGVGSSEVAQSSVLAAHDRPSRFDEPPVPYSVFTSSTGVSASIQLQRQIMGEEGEVDDVRTDGVLEAEIDSEAVEGVDKTGFMARRVPSVAVRERAGFLPAIFGIPHGVVGGHSLGMPFGEPLRLFGLLGTPMVFSGRPLTLPGVERGGFRLPPDRDVVPVAGVVEGGLPKAEVTLDGSDTFPAVPVTTRDEGSDSLGVRQVNGGHGSSRWVVATIISNDELSYQGEVWNLAVEGDETFTAEGVVVHNCRSVITPEVRWDNLPVDRPPRGTRQSMDGQVSSKTTYENWLRDQSKERQNEVLGPSRAKLFREKDVGLDEMVKNDGKRVTVDELRERADG